MTKETLKQVIEELRKENPYPPDIFIRPTKEEWERLHKMFEKEGIKQDCFFADAMARSYDNALYMIEKRLGDFLDSESNEIQAFSEWLKDNYSIEIHDMIIQDYIKYNQKDKPNPASPESSFLS